ncbi:hypothetical protein FRC17_001560, partial [Serendipita sp. 399]
MKPRRKFQVSDPNNAPEAEILASLHSKYQLVMPPELWIKILSYIPLKRDLCRLSLVCRTLQAIIEPYLYKEVIVNTSYSFWAIPDTQGRLSVLYRAIRTPRLANHIVVFKIWLNGYTVPCPDYCLGTLSDSDPRKPTDDELGEILVNLPRLRLLSYGCRLHGCGTHRNRPRLRLHNWLANLRTDTLHHLEIGCGDYQWNLDDFRVLSAPCMQNLKAFKVDALCSESSEEFASMLQTSGNISQNITSLCYLDSAAHNWILSHRPIKNIVCIQEELATHLYTDHRPALAEALLKSKTARLEKLYVVDVETWLPNQNPLPYLNLVSIGSISLSHGISEERIPQRLRPLAFLTRLQLIEFVTTSIMPTPWSDELLDRIGRTVPSVQRFYLAMLGFPARAYTVPTATMYEKD